MNDSLLKEENTIQMFDVTRNHVIIVLNTPFVRTHMLNFFNDKGELFNTVYVNTILSN